MLERLLNLPKILMVLYLSGPEFRKVRKEVLEAIETMALAYADGRISKSERTAIMKEIDEAWAASRALMMSMPLED